MCNVGHPSQPPRAPTQVQTRRTKQTTPRSSGSFRSPTTSNPTSELENYDTIALNMFGEAIQKMKTMGARQVMLQVLNFATVIATGLMIWKGLGLALNNESPIVVVLSGSMEPAFYRGDLLFLHNPRDTPFEVGDITVYKLNGVEVPIVHRILETHTLRLNPLKQKILTKGDNNFDDDLGLYNGREWLDREHLIGKVRGFIPYIGYVTIAMNDFPWLKYILIGILGLLALFQRE
ncbi:Signal peptidase complex catalytic subunit [Tulasnella sp. 427]|nr:Signal peptidase complex catalytic subunit [Tulasnella sp. 427]